MNFPFIATLVFIGGLFFLLLSVLLSMWRYFRKPLPADQSQVPDDFGPKLTSKRLRYVRWLFALLVIGAFGFHVYWALFAAGPLQENSAFAHLKNTRDQRNRREAEANLRGWVFDRHKDYRKALAKYRYLNGKIIRDYPLGAAGAHLIGYSGLARGDAMLERAVIAQPPPKEPEKNWWEKIVSYASFSANEPKIEAGRDLQLTIDYELQKAAFDQLQSRKGAVVIVNPQTGEILAMVSAPSYDPDDINNDAKWEEIRHDLKNRPLLNRALDEYYLPGSTLKTITAAAALDSRLDSKSFLCQGEGWTPPGSGRPIRDDEGEAHGRLNLIDAYAKSCNQYFAQLGVEVERQRMSEAASRFGLKVFSNAADSIGSGSVHGLWNSENKILNDVLAPLNSTFVAGPKITKYDLALESIGQGYVQLTPFQMAFVAAAVANSQGNVMRPLIETGRQPVILSQAMTIDTAKRMRELMEAVVERGTASGTFGTLVRQQGISAGGKTGTAQREVPVIDPKTEQPVTYRDSKGKEHVKKENRIDSWFIGFAPVTNPQIAWAVVVEGGGYGAKTSAPIAANLVVKAKELGLLVPGGVPISSPTPIASVSPRASRPVTRR